MGDVRSGANEGLAKKAIPNVVFNFLPFVLTALVGLFMVPFFIGKLGIVAYSVVPLALSMTGYVTLVSDAISNSIGRYLAIAVQRGDHEDAERVYNTAFFGLLRIMAVAIPIVIVISVFSTAIFNITWSDPLGVQVLFLTILGSVIVISWSSLFLMVLFASNRLDLVGMVKSANIAFQFGLIVIFLTIQTPDVVYIGISYLLASFLFMFLGWIFMKGVQPDLRVRRSSYDGRYFREMCGLGGWTLINNLGNLLFIQMSLIMVNLLYGSNWGGNFGIVVSIVTMIISSTIIFSEVFAPPIYHYYSAGDKERMNLVSRFSVKATGLVLGFPLAFLFIFTPDLLSAWVGSQFAFLTPVIMVMVGLMVGTQSIVPAFTLTMAYKSMRFPAMMSLLFGLLNMALILVFYLTTDMGIMGVAIAWAVSMFLKNCLVMPWYIAKVTEVENRTYFLSLANGFAYFAAGVMVCFAIDRLLDPSFSFFGLVAAFAVLYVLSTLAFIPTLRKYEKEMLLSTLPGFIASSQVAKRLFK